MSVGKRSELMRDTPARILRMPVTICAGSFVEIGPAHDAGGVEVCSCWAWACKSQPPGDGGPAAVAPFMVGADELRAQGLLS